MSRFTTEVSSGNYIAARLVDRVGVLLALLEVGYGVLLLVGMDATSGFFRFVRNLAAPLALFFPGLFAFPNQDLSIIVNYGLAALFWVVLSGFVARLLV